MYAQTTLYSRVELAIFYTLSLTYIKRLLTKLIVYPLLQLIHAYPFSIQINHLKLVLFNLEHCTILHLFYCHTHDTDG